MQSPILPSPLCDKELEEIIFTAGRGRQLKDSGTKQSESDAQVAAELKPNSPLPCWTCSAILTNEVSSINRFY